MTATTDRFMKAGVPRSVWGISCEETGRSGINTWADGLKQNKDIGGALLSVYVWNTGKLGDTERVSASLQYVELCARQAVVRGLSVRVVPFLKLLHTLEHPPMSYDEDQAPAFVLAVPYLPILEEANCSPYQYGLVVDHLLGHMYDGGSLVTSGSRELGKRLQSRYPNTLERMLVENADIVGV